MKRSVVLFVVALVVGVLLSVSPAALADGPVHRVTVGSADTVVFPLGTDANFSLHAIERADGTVTGQWQDTFGGMPPNPARNVHIDITCLTVDGNDAWVSGVITRAHPDLIPTGYVVGAPVITQVRDNGQSANDPADQVSFTILTDSADDCLDMPDLPLFDLNNGQAKVD